MKQKLLLVEDNKEIQALVVATLKDYQMVCAGTLGEAHRLLETDQFSLVLLDVHLPDGDGFQFVLKLQSIGLAKEIPVIFLTARAETLDKVMGFRLGAEDYITKPFDCLELKARVEARLKRLTDREAQEGFFTNGTLSFDLLRARATVSIDGTSKPVSLTPFEFKLLLYLAKHEEHVLSREQLVENVWEDGLNVSDRTVDTHMSHLRQKIRGSGFSIQSVYGEGYRFSRVSPTRTRSTPPNAPSQGTKSLKQGYATR